LQYLSITDIVDALYKCTTLTYLLSSLLILRRRTSVTEVKKQPMQINITTPW